MNSVIEEEAEKQEAETTTQTRYYLTSLSPQCPTIVRNVQRAIRNHWGIENSLHHCQVILEMTPTSTKELPPPLQGKKSAKGGSAIENSLFYRDSIARELFDNI